VIRAILAEESPLPLRKGKERLEVGGHTNVGTFLIYTFVCFISRIVSLFRRRPRRRGDD
jgi:hypothetical protein